MKTLALFLALCCSSCVAHIERPYLKETTTTKDGTITIREYSAEYIGGSGNLKKVQDVGR